MEFNTVNIIKKFGVAQRILQGDATLHKLFLTQHWQICVTATGVSMLKLTWISKKWRN